MAGQHRGDFDALHLPAGEGGVHLSIQVFPAAQAHPAQHFADAGGRQGLAGGQLQQAADGKALKPHRLLKGEADPSPSPLGDVQGGDVLAVQEYFAAVGCFDAGDKLSEGSFAAAVGAGDDRQFPLGHGEAHVPHNLAAAGGGPGDVL